MGLHVNKWSTDNWLLVNNDTSSLSESLIDGSDAIIWALNLTKEDWLLESWGGSELTGVHGSSGGRNNLTSTSVDSIGVESDIMDIESDTSHVLVAHDTLFGGPLESSLHRVLDFVKELNSLSGINEYVSSTGVWSESPNLEGISLVPFILLRKSFSSLFSFLLWSNSLSLNLVSKFILHWDSLHENSVMLVWRFRKAHLGRFLSNCFLVGNDWVSDLDFTLSILLNEILKADLDVELTTTGNNMLTSLFSDTKNKWIRLRELLKTLYKLWKIGSVLDIDGNSYNGRYGELHDSDVVSSLIGGDGSLLKDVLINTNKTDGVTTWYIWDGFDFTSHHDDGSLDILDVKIGLASGSVVRSHDSDLLSGRNNSGENSTEGVESSLIVGGDHLGDEDHEWTILIAIKHGLTRWVINWSFIKIGRSVLLSLDWTWELEDDHFKKSLGSVNPLLEHILHEMLSGQFQLVSLEVDLKGADHLCNLLHLTIHGGSAESDNWLHHELNESSLEFFTIIRLVVVLPFLGSLIKVVVTPKLLHHLILSDTEFLGVNFSELGDGEGPSEEGRSEGASSSNWVNLQLIGHSLDLESGDDDVNILNNSEEFLIHGFSVNLELEDTSIDLIDHENWSDLLSKSLSENGLGLHSSTLDVIDDNKGSISDS